MSEEKQNTQEIAAVQVIPMEKDPERMMAAADSGSMVAMLCGSEILYLFVGDGAYQVFIHLIGAPDGRRRAYPMDDSSRTMLKNLAPTTDQLFAVTYPKRMNPMGVMYTAETEIRNYNGQSSPHNI